MKNRSGTRPLTRRAACRLLATGMVGSGFATAAVRAQAAERAPRQITFHNTHTLESLSVEYRRGTAYLGDALTAVNHVLRDHRNGEVHVIDPGLLDLLTDVAFHLDRDAEFEVISGYRSPASNAAMHARSHGVAEHSLHVEGRAIDVRLVRCDLGRLRDTGLALGRGGVGYYRASNFVHLDTGRPRWWVG